MPSVPGVCRGALTSLVPVILASSIGLSQDKGPESVAPYRDCVIAYALRFAETMESPSDIATAAYRPVSVCGERS